MKKIIAGVFLVMVIASCPRMSLASGEDVVSSSQRSFEGFRMEDAVINVAETVGEAVVSISTEYTAKIPGTSRKFSYSYPFSGQTPFSQNDPLRGFFEDFFGEMPEREFKRAGLGSGVIIDPQGYILTNEHVIDEADTITVKLSDGREFQGEVKGHDARSDLAVVKINAGNLPFARIGDSDTLKIGQWVVAVGNPFGFALDDAEPTVTVGVISALHRSLGKTVSRDRDYNDLIQTDAAINPGNSGGPLVSLKGEVVGINVAIFSTSGGYQGIGFAIPAATAKRIINRLIEGKTILYGWLGVTVQDLNEELTKHFGLPQASGALVAKVLKGSPAEKAGMKPGDVITLFDGKPVTNVRELLSKVGVAEVGKKVKTSLIRDKKAVVLDVMVGQRPQEIKEEVVRKSEEENWRGLQVADISSSSLWQEKFEEKEGVVVVDVQPNSSADKAGITAGDLILEINKQKIADSAAYQKVVRTIKGDALIRTSRGYFIVKAGEK